MIDNTTNTDEVTPEQMAAIVARTQPAAGPQIDLAPDTATDERLKPRSVKMSDELDLRIGLRASELGLSKSAYLRWLAEQDLHHAYSDEPEMIPLLQARQTAARAVEQALNQLSHRPGHAA